MSDFSVRSESIDVEQIMEQIRARIREKRGVDYTEQQLRELAAVKLEKVLDPRGVRSDLLQRFKERQPPYEKPELPLYGFENSTIYDTHRGIVRWFRKLLNPLLKLLFNPNPIIDALHAQAKINDLNLAREEGQERRRLEMESLHYEVIHNLVFELTRLGIEVKNLKMQVGSLAGRLEFNERRARALESAVVYKPSTDDADVDEDMPSETPQASSGQEPSPATPSAGTTPEGPGQRSRRRRRRRGRRSGAPAGAVFGQPPQDAGNSVGGQRPQTLEQAIGAESHPTEPPSAPFETPAAVSSPEVSPHFEPSRSGSGEAESSATRPAMSHESSVEPPSESGPTSTPAESSGQGSNDDHQP